MVDLNDAAHACPDLCNESAWTGFAETVMKFRHLQTVELVRDHDFEERRLDSDPQSFGLMVETFQPLIEVGKLECQLVDLGSEKIIYTDTPRIFDPDVWVRLKKKVVDGDSDSDAESEEAVNDQEMVDHGELFSPRSVLTGTNEYLEQLRVTLRDSEEDGRQVHIC